MAGRVWRRPPPHALAVDALHLAGAAAAAVVPVTAHGPAARGAGGDERLVAGLEGGQRRVVLGVLAARVRRGRRTAARGTSRTVGAGGEGRFIQLHNCLVSAMLRFMQNHHDKREF